MSREPESRQRQPIRSNSTEATISDSNRELAAGLDDILELVLDAVDTLEPVLDVHAVDTIDPMLRLALVHVHCVDFAEHPAIGTMTYQFPMAATVLVDTLDKTAVATTAADIQAKDPLP